MGLAFPLFALLLGAPQATEDTATTVTARPVSGATGAVTTVSSDEVAASEARSGADFLREVPGLNLLASGGRAGVTERLDPRLRPHFMLVLLDGIPLNDSTELQGGAVNLDEISADLVGHAEGRAGACSSS